MLWVVQPFGAWSSSNTPAELGAEATTILRRPTAGWSVAHVDNNTDESGIYSLYFDEIKGVSVQLQAAGSVQRFSFPAHEDRSSGQPAISFYHKTKLFAPDTNHPHIVTRLRGFGWAQAYIRVIYTIGWR